MKHIKAISPRERLRLLTFVLLLAAAVHLLSAGPTRAFETDVITRDPSTVVKEMGTYWVYGTGQGIQQFSSTDRIHWTRRGPVFPTSPTWVVGAVPANRNNNVWAPDVHYFNKLWHLYYCYPTIL